VTDPASEVAGKAPADRNVPTTQELEGVALYDPSSPDAADRLSLLYEAVSLGASLEQLVARPNLGELILDLRLRPRLAVTLGEVVRQTELEWAQAERLLKAIGLPVDPEARITAGEEVAVRVLAAAASDFLGFESTLQLARAAGEAMARVAEALVAAVRLRVELPNRQSGTPYGETVRQYSELAETVLPDFVQALEAALRRQVIGVADRVWSNDSERSAIVLPRTVGFADLVGYTAAASKLSARELSRVLMEFDDLTSVIVADGGGQIVKMIGDEVMFVAEKAVDACRIGSRLVRSFRDSALPPVRVGLAAGDLVSMFGDLYGAEVNIAARLVDAAEPGTVLVSERVKVESSSEFVFEWLPALDLRGIDGPVPVARLVITDGI
jgi:adenylate cyclase